MKKKLFGAVCALAAFCAITAGVHADGIKINIDGQELQCEAAPVMIDERVLVPMRSIFEALGAEVSWFDYTAWAVKNDEFISLPINSDKMSTGIINSASEYKWGEEIFLDVPAQLIGDYTYVPVRAVSETLRANVDWDGENQTVIINTQQISQGQVYYTSADDGNKLYRIDSNGQNRKRITENSCNDLKYLDGYIYFTSNDNGCYYRVSEDGSVEQQLIDRPANIICIEDDYIYYTTKDTEILYRVCVTGDDNCQLTEHAVLNPYYYSGMIYYNKENDNNMYVRTMDGSFVNSVTLGDPGIKLYPFNCFFFNTYILIENGVWYGNIMRVDLDGNNVTALNSQNSQICKNQVEDNKILFINADEGQDVYIMGIDGSNNRQLVDVDSSWIYVDVISQWDDIVYYKNMMHEEIYSIRLDGSDNKYVCYANDAKAIEGRLYATYEGLYVGNLDGSYMKKLYDGNVKDYKVKNGYVYLEDESNSKMYRVSENDDKITVTYDKVTNWVSDF